MEIAKLFKEVERQPDQRFIDSANRKARILLSTWQRIRRVMMLWFRILLVTGIVAAIVLVVLAGEPVSPDMIIDISDPATDTKLRVLGYVSVFSLLLAGFLLVAEGVINVIISITRVLVDNVPDLFWAIARPSSEWVRKKVAEYYEWHEDRAEARRLTQLSEQKRTVDQGSVEEKSDR